MRLVGLVGAVLVIASAGAIVGYVSYLFISSRDAGLVMKVAVPAGALGLVLLLVTVLRERLAVRGHEGLEEAKP